MRATMVCGFLAYTKNLGRIETRTRDKKYLGWCDQFETSPDAIEPELRTALCERRQTDRLKTNYSIDILAYLHRENVSGRKTEGGFERECDREG